MPASIRSLLNTPEFRLELICGEGERLRDPIEWATTTEVPEPGPFLTGGQLVLTTGMRLQTPKVQRSFVRALVAADSRGLCFSLGFEHDEMPEALVDEARKSGLPIVLLPYEVPFSRIVRFISQAHASEQVAAIETMHRLHQQLVQAMLTNGGLDGLVAQLAHITNARVAVSRYGEVLAGDVEAGEGPNHDPEEDIEGWDTLAVSAGTNMLATLHVSRPRRHERVLNYARSLVSLQLTEESRRIQGDREQAGQSFADIVRGRVPAEEAEVRLGALGVAGGRYRALVVAADARRGRGLGSMPLPKSLEHAVAAMIDEELVVLVPGKQDARAAADSIVGLARAAGLQVRVGIGDAYPVSQALRWSYYEARDALSHLEQEASVAEASRLSIASLILASEDVPVEELAAEILGPIERADRDHGSALVDTLDAYLAESGAVATVAAILGTHRNTVRYRLDQITQLTGLDPRVTGDAVQLWLARAARRLGGRG